jgi:hypothetical protein
MKLDTIFEQEFTKLNLKRVRLKTDPANQNTSYEGYVLYEKRKFPKVLKELMTNLGLLKKS